MAGSSTKSTRRLQRHSLGSKLQLEQLLDNLIINHKEKPFNIGDSYREKHSKDDISGSQSDTINEDISNDDSKHHHDDSIHSMFSSKEFVHEPLELSIMASLKQVRGNSGTLFKLMHYSQVDGKHHR